MKIPSAAMAKTERFLRVSWREPESFKDLELKRKLPKKWESEDEITEDEEGLERAPLKPAWERIVEGLL